MRARARRMLLDLDEAALLELAHLYCVWRVTRGATHTLNNALTALAGLIEAPGDETLVDVELERCARAARGLTAHHALRFGREEDAELTGLVRRTAALLGDSLGSRYALEVEIPADFFYLEADPARVELLLLVLGYRLVDLSARGGRLRLGVAEGEKPASACVELELLAGDLPEAAAESLFDPAAASGAGAALALEAAGVIAAGCEVSLAARRLPGGLRVRALFPCAEA